jgi:putative membrane protein
VRALIQIVLNGLGLWLTATLVPGVIYTGGLLQLLVAGLLIGIINLIVRPIVTLLSLPFIIVTLGLFFLVINALMLQLAAFLLPGLTVQGCLPAILGGIVMALFNWFVRAFEKEDA